MNILRTSECRLSTLSPTDTYPVPGPFPKITPSIPPLFKVLIASLNRMSLPCDKKVLFTPMVSEINPSNFPNMNSHANTIKTEFMTSKTFQEIHRDESGFDTFMIKHTIRAKMTIRLIEISEINKQKKEYPYRRDR
jgi:hypothetical protein